MAVLDDFLFRCWQMGRLDRYDDTVDAIMPMTLENAINFLDEIGWRAEHDRIMSTPQWIPCEERLPEEEDSYLVTLRWEREPEEVDTDVLWYSPARGFDTINAYTVIAWMPLPEPYEEEIDE